MIYYKTDDEIAKIREAGQLARKCLDFIATAIMPGVSTQILNDLCHGFFMSAGAYPAPLMYKGFPKSICTSVNNVVCHGIPSPYEILRDGDIINIDVTALLNGYHGDTSRTFLVGTGHNDATKKLVECTKRCMELGIAQVKVGNTVGDIGHAIQTEAEKNGFSVVRDFVGHGIGKIFHEGPAIFHYGKPKTGDFLLPGMTFTIEPMINEGTADVSILNDGWTTLTADGSLSAQFEHTIAILANGKVEILTK